MSDNTQDPREQLITELKRHDWDYQYSDDYRQWSSGSKRHSLILRLVAQVPDGQALYAQYKPKQ